MSELIKIVEVIGVIEIWKELLLEFLCDFLIKIMGKVYFEFKDMIFKVVVVYDNEIDVEKIEECVLSGGNYMGFMIIVCVMSQEQFDNIYCVLIGYLMVKVVF